MSGIGVGLASSFLWASEGDVRHFFGGWFLDRLGLNPAGVELFRLRAGRRPELPPKLLLQLHPQLHPLHGFCMVFSCFRSCLSGDVRHWHWPFFIFLVGVKRRREALFRGLVFGQVGLESCWGWAVSAPCRTEAGAATEAAIAAPSTTWFLHGFFMLSKLPVWRCQALALALLHLSCGRPKATLGTFSGAGFWTGWA